MVDNTIATQIRPFQMPDIGQIYGNVQNIQMNRMRMAEAEELGRERNALRDLAATGVDPYSPEGLAQLRRSAPTLAPRLQQAGIAMQREQRAGEKDAAEVAATRIRMARDLLPSVTNAEQFNAWRTSTIASLPGLDSVIPREYSPEAVRRLMLTADEALKNHYVSQEGEGGRRVIAINPVTQQAAIVLGSEMAASPRRPTPLAVQGVPGGVVFADPDTLTVTPGREVPVGATPAPAAPAARVPTSQSDDPLRIDSAIRRAEGTGQNPRSSAQGQYQFVDRTFVEQFRRAFPQAAEGRSDAEVLRYRGAALPDGRRVEDVLGPAFTQQNMQTLTRAGVSPTGGNVYLAHHFGAQGALNLLRADPNTPIERVLPREVLDANPFLRGSSVGQITTWAGNAVDYGPGEARRLLVAARQPSAEPGAPSPVNLMAPAPTGVNAMRPPTTVQEMRDQALFRALEQKRGEQRVAREDQPGRVEEAGQRAEAEARARTTVTQEEEERKRQRGQRQLEDTLSEMLAQYEELRRLGGITSSAEGASLSNIPAFVSGTRIGQLGSRAVATPSQTARDQLQSLQNQLLQAFKGATGMTGKEADSNQDVLRLLAAMSDPTMSIEAVRGILQSFSRRYGLGELVIPETPAPAAAPSREQTPGPRRGAAPPAAPAASTRPTLEQFLARARQANPGATDQQLTDFWNQRYGGR